MADDGISSVDTSSAASNAARVAQQAGEDAARNQATQQAQKTPTGAAAADKSRDEQAAASVDNERGRAAADKLGADPAKASEPAAPAAATKSVDKVYQDAGAKPPDQGAFSREVLSQKDGEMRGALMDAVANKAGVEVPGDPSPYVGRADQDRINHRSSEISGALVHGAVDAPNREPSAPGVKSSDLTADEKAGLKDPAKRGATADAIGQRIASQEAMVSAAGGKENLDKLSDTWAKASEQERADMKAEAQKSADQAHSVKSTIGNAALLATGIGDAAVAGRAAVTGVRALATAEGRALLADGAKSAVKNVGDVAAKAVDGIKGALGLETSAVTAAKLLDSGALKAADKAADVMRSTGVLPSTAERASRDLAAELSRTGGTPIAGPGMKDAVKDAPRLAAQYGGKESDWVKVSTSSREIERTGQITRAPGQSAETFPPARPTVDQGNKFAPNAKLEVHAYRNTQTGQIVDPKLVAYPATGGKFTFDF